MRVLVAEDDPLIALGLCERLRSLGHVPIGPASDGAEAIELARASLPDLYLFDIEMPNIDGLEAAAQLADDGFRLNISSMRSVTTNPPTMFAVASTTATRPRVI